MIEMADLAWFGQQYVGSEADLSDPRLALDTADLSQLPPTLILTNECDPLRDEAEELAGSIATAGGSVELERFDGLAHAAFWLSLAVPRCSDQRERVAVFVRERTRARLPTAV